MTLEDYLRQDAERYADKVAVVCDGRQMTYRELYAAVCERAATLPKGEVIAFRNSQDIDFLITYFAIHLAGSIAAPLEKDTPEARFQQIAKDAEQMTGPTSFIPQALQAVRRVSSSAIGPSLPMPRT